MLFYTNIILFVGNKIYIKELNCLSYDVSDMRSNMKWKDQSLYSIIIMFYSFIHSFAFTFIIWIIRVQNIRNRETVVMAHESFITNNR